MPKKHPKSTRRQFLQTGAKAGALAYLFANPAISFGNDLLSNKDVMGGENSKKLKILILGGTSFLGPHQIAYALGRGHSISTFTRGKTKPTVHQDLFDLVESLIGDREDNLEALKGRSWDAVIDNSGYKVQWTRDTANLLKDNCGIYLYTSSTGVYYPYLGDSISEKTSTVLTVPSGATEEEKYEYDYGVMKAGSEIAAMDAFGAKRTIAVRPTYMMGPGDKTDRFTYWPVRLKKGGEILVPGKPDDLVQYIDVRDVAEWMIRLIEQKNSGTFNAVGPASATGMIQFVYGVHAAYNSKASFVSIPDYDFLNKQNVPYSIPWVMPTNDHYGTSRISNNFAVSNGLTYRPLAESCREITDWWYSDVVSEERRQKMLAGPESLMTREKDVLQAWKTKTSLGGN